jgi:hypothetical protein
MRASVVLSLACVVLLATCSGRDPQWEYAVYFLSGTTPLLDPPDIVAYDGWSITADSLVGTACAQNEICVMNWLGRRGWEIAGFRRDGVTAENTSWYFKRHPRGRDRPTRPE